MRGSTALTRITCGSVAQLSSVLLLLLFIIINIYKAPYIRDQPVHRRVLLQGFRVFVCPCFRLFKALGKFFYFISPHLIQLYK